jgi:hypothetical protein
MPNSIHAQIIDDAFGEGAQGGHENPASLVDCGDCVPLVVSLVRKFAAFFALRYACSAVICRSC